MTRKICSLIALSFAVLVFAQRGDACVQLDVPYVKLRAAALNGTVTLNTKPIEGALLSLHRYIRPYSPEIGHFEAHSLRTVKTDENGRFTFGAVLPGKYVILMSKPSAEATDVELLPAKAGSGEKIAIEFFADFCQRAFVISAEGRPVDTPSSSRTIGMHGHTYGGIESQPFGHR